MVRNWEQLMCNRNDRIAKRQVKIDQIKAQTKAMLTEKDLKEHERFILQVFPEAKNEPYLIEVYKEKFMDDFIERKVKDKLGIEKANELNDLIGLNNSDRDKNRRSLRRHPN